MKPLPSLPNPWITHKSEKIYDSPWISLTKHEVTNPGGHPGTYSVVHFQNIAIGVIVLDEELNTWLVGQWRYPLEKYTWEIPEGGGNPQVDPLESAQRELQEETGISAKKWTKILTMHLSNSATDEYCVLFLAQDLTFGEAKPEDDEALEVMKIPFEEFYQRVESGEITDSLTVAAALKIKVMLLGNVLNNKS